MARVVLGVGRVSLLFIFICVGESWGQTSLLSAQDSAQLADLAVKNGDAARGALLYFNPEMTCIKCHEPVGNAPRLGPEIAAINREVTPEYLVDSILHPSKEFTEGFQSTTVLTLDGEQITGLVLSETDDELTLTDPAEDGKIYNIPQDDIDDRKPSSVSAMPEGLAAQLGTEQQLLDLIKFLVEVKKGGTQTMLQLKPPESMFALAPLPEYESNIDHARMIKGLNRKSFERGQEIFGRYCARCHGTKEIEGTMPTALRFAEGKFKNGSDPYQMYQTLTHGYGLMVAQRWMVPKQKYDVIHYIREEFLRTSNPTQHFSIEDNYLTGLPTGSELGPDPVEQRPWIEMDYGPSLVNTYEVGKDGSNIAYKGIAIRLDAGPGGVSQGNHWVLFEHDTMRVAAAWSGKGFIDWNGIHFNDKHQVHPRIVGNLHYANPTGPGWAEPGTDSFADNKRVVGRDDRRYGPLPESWAKFRGFYRYQDRTVLNYTVGSTEVLELPSLDFVGQQPVFGRVMELGKRETPLLVKVATIPELSSPDVRTVLSGKSVMIIGANEEPANVTKRKFDGASFLQTKNTLDWSNDLTIRARIKTQQGGTIICQTRNDNEWVPGGKTLFVRGGRLGFDIGWVGVVTSRKRIADNKWHDVVLTWRPDEEEVSLYVDGELDREGELDPGEEFDNPVVRIGYTASDFPNPSAFQGDIESIQVWSRALAADEIADLADSDGLAEDLAANWQFADSTDDGLVTDRSESGNHATWKSSGSATPTASLNHLWAVAYGIDDPEWLTVDNAICLRIPAGEEPLQLEIRTAACESNALASRTLVNELNERESRSASRIDLRALCDGGPALWNETFSTEIKTRFESGPFAVDDLWHPQENPWSCRLRLTGLDFYSDANRAAVCAWDGSVWEVSGFLDGNELTWRRIACGLFQPLGLKIIDEMIYVTCRDQIAVLHDLNDDGEIDFYRCFNSDHQVTEHFHEFAMGLQVDEQGNLYYAKSARHAKTPLVPHHGTLLKVTPDGAETEIVAYGFRAANGVCINGDGSFFVTDQEGHWNPKNRINWVRPGGFYGNMWGYHDITDEADEAMEEPLCWITNAFDRSPGELMWVDSETWGPLNGALLNLSYGMGQVFVVPYERLSDEYDGRWQGGMCSLPIPLFPTGVMRGRFNPSDGQLYCCGMYAWAGNQQKPGGLYRIRYTGEPVHLPLAISASGDDVTIQFSDKLDPDSVKDLERYSIKTWDIRRSANYGSPHLDERELKIAAASIGDDGQTVTLTLPELAATRCMEIKYALTSLDGLPVVGTIHNTINVLPD